MLTLFTKDGNVEESLSIVRGKDVKKAAGCHFRCRWTIDFFSPDDGFFLLLQFHLVRGL